MDIIGKKYLVTFGMAKAILHFVSEMSLSFTILEKDGQLAEVSETVAITLTELRPKLNLATWTEKSGTTVTQVQDYENGVIYSNWTVPGEGFKNIKGTLAEV